MGLIVLKGKNGLEVHGRQHPDIVACGRESEELRQICHEAMEGLVEETFGATCHDCGWPGDGVCQIRARTPGEALAEAHRRHDKAQMEFAPHLRCPGIFVSVFPLR